MFPMHTIYEFAELGALRMPEKLVGSEQEWRCITTRWSFTESGFVKKSAKLYIPFLHITMNSCICTRSRNQWFCMSILFVRLGSIVLLTIPEATSLSKRIFLGGCGYSRSNKFLRIPDAICPVWNAAAYSAPPNDAITFWIIELNTRMGPLIWVESSFPR